MILSLLLCGGGEEPQHWVLMCTQWPGQPWTAPARDADAHQPINRSLHICSLQKLHGPPSTVQRWLSDLLHCPRYSTAPAKNQPPWKAAKKLQQCESRNKLGTCIIIAAIARISPAIFPPMCELFFTHAMRHRKAFTLPEPRQQNAPPPQPWPDTRGITPCSFSQVLPSNYDHCENFSSPWNLQSAFKYKLLSSTAHFLGATAIKTLQKSMSYKTHQSRPKLVCIAFLQKDCSKQEKIFIPKMSMVLGLAWRS